MAEFLTKTEWKKPKNTQNIFLDGCYRASTFCAAFARKPPVYILKLRRETG